ncbi:monocarboxylate transporter 3-like [Watersipora subatra]|uniref:monocarboxylate transporter 3-like n=1 Tax=Watersipora subatra TaxID=2589382 RepID=UPI00355AE86B
MKGFCRRINLKKDKGYAWLVLAFAIITYGLHMGFGLAVVGNMTIAHQKLFDIGVEQAGLISTAHLASIFLFGPIASLFTKRFGCRAVSIFGGCCVIVGVGVSSFSTQPWHAFVLFGIVAGAGIGCLLISSTEALAKYFDKYRYLAFSLVTLGQNVGITAWASLSQLLLDNFGYATAMRILASFHIVHVIFGIALVEPTSEVSEGRKRESFSDHPDATNIKNEVACEKIGEDEEQGESTQRETKLEGSIEMTKPTFRQIFTSTLKSFEAWILILNQLLWGTNEATALAFTNDFIVYKLNLSEEEAALGITILGIATICASLLVMALSKLTFNRTIPHAVGTAVFGLSTIGIAFSVNKAMFYSMCALFGLGHGTCISNLAAFLYEYTTADRFAILFGVMMLAEGVAVISSTPLVGYIILHVGEEYGMIFSGCCGVIATLSLLPIPARRVWKSRKYAEEMEVAVTFQKTKTTET